MAMLLGFGWITGSLAGQLDANPDFDDAWQRYATARDSGHKKKQLAAAEEVLTIAEQSFDKDDKRLPALMINYGNALLATGNIVKARDVLKKSVKRSEDLYGKASVDVIPALMNYADARADMHNSRRQEQTYERALDIAATHYGSQSIEYGDIAFRAGIRILERAATTDGEQYLVQARDVYSTVNGMDSREAGLASFYLGKTELAKRKYAPAIDHFLAALNTFDGDDPQDKRFAMISRAFLVQSYETIGESDKATEHCIAIGANRMMTPDQDYEPIFRQAPRYPVDMLRRGEQGYVDVAFTVDANGFVKNPDVIKRKGGASFAAAAVKAVKKFRYAPQFDSGQPIAVDDVKTRITFKIEQ